MNLGSKEFYSYYEAAHQNLMNRYVHHLAHSLAVVGIVMLAFKPPLTGLVLIALAFCLSWAGHYLFEKNTPAFFETGALNGKGESASHHVKIAIGGVIWSFVCFLRLFRLGPLAT